MDPSKYADKEVIVRGWVRQNRNSNKFGFLAINDGSFFKPVQVVYEANEIDNIENKKANTHLQNSENISKQTSEEIKDNSKLSEFYKQEKKLQEEANKIINSIDEMQNTLDTLKKNYETTITKVSSDSCVFNFGTFRWRYGCLLLFM